MTALRRAGAAPRGGPAFGGQWVGRRGVGSRAVNPPCLAAWMTFCRGARAFDCWLKVRGLQVRMRSFRTRLRWQPNSLVQPGAMKFSRACTHVSPILTPQSPLPPPPDPTPPHPTQRHLLEGHHRRQEHEDQLGYRYGRVPVASQAHRTRNEGGVGACVRTC
jgi:hypothetical protein